MASSTTSATRKKKHRFDQYPSSQPEKPSERRRRLRGVKAWLITWQTRAEPDDQRVVAVLSPRWAAERVGDIATVIFAAERFEPGEMRSAMLMRRNAPGTPVWARVEVNYFGEIQSAPWKVRFTIGGDLYLCGRLVENLREPEFGTLTWDEIPIPARVG